MNINVLLGVGGTGAKVVESALHVLLSGFGPDEGPTEVHVGLVDQDAANGNTVRTKELLDSIVRLQTDLRPGGPDPLDHGDAARPGSPFARVKLRPLFEGGVWRPASGERQTLAQLLERNSLGPDHKGLFDALFLPGEEEQDMPLGLGYRGRAHLGSAALLDSLTPDSEFVRRLAELMDQTGQGRTLRLFIVGSAFGGTGAAGFPTLSRTLHRMRRDTPRGRTRDVRIGGCLMLPYFGFSDPADEGANVVRASELLPQTRTALEFYDRLLEDPEARPFDRLYLTGWSRWFQLGYHRAGNRDQVNPPLAPELVGALAAIAFLQDETVEPAARPEVLVASREDGRRVGWRDLPVLDEGRRRELQARLGGLLRFAAYWRLRAEPDVERRRPKVELLADKGLRGIDWKGSAAALRQDLGAVLEATLAWAGALQLTAVREHQGFDLWNVLELAPGSGEPPPAPTVRVTEVLGPDALRSAHGRILTSAEPTRGAGAVFEAFDEVRRRGSPPEEAGSGGLARLVHAVHRAARPFDA